VIDYLEAPELFFASQVRNPKWKGSGRKKANKIRVCTSGPCLLN
jgi:hypothetical protein